MGAEIIDGVGLSDHVTSDQVGASHAGSIGPGALILDYGESLAYSIVSNNQINIADGVFMIQGKRGWIIPGTVEQINIATGQNGQYRNDLICIKYSRDPESSVESFDFEVVQGTPGASGTDPTVTTGDINDGALESYSPIYRVRLNGINIAGVDLMATKVTTLIDLAGNIGNLQALETDNKTNIVAAMNELKDGINELNGNFQNIRAEYSRYGIAANNGNIYSTEQQLSYKGTPLTNTLNWTCVIEISCDGTSLSSYARYVLSRADLYLIDEKGDTSRGNFPAIRINSAGMVCMYFKGTTDQSYTVGVNIVRL